VKCGIELLRRCGSCVGLLCVVVALALGGCATTQPDAAPAGPYGAQSTPTAPPAASASEFQQQIDQQARLTDLNEQLLVLAVESGLGGGVYRVGAEDKIQIDVFGVPDLSREYRVDGGGKIVMPLIGPVMVSGLSLDEVEQVVARKYGESYLRSPQISAQVTEFRSQQFTVVGAVSSPRVYSVSRQTTLIEALAMAGGVTADSGGQVYLMDRVRDPETGMLQTRSLLIDVDELLRDAAQHNLVLGESALINVPRGGVIFVEGQVNRPGAFQQRQARTVLTALAQAGGMKFEADRSQLRVLRRDGVTGDWMNFEVDYAVIREDPARDIELLNGDVVVVGSDALRVGWTSAWRAVTGLVLLGFRPL
jgi:polysaccharide biosynthesis/export protein